MKRLFDGDLPDDVQLIIAGMQIDPKGTAKEIVANIRSLEFEIRVLRSYGNKDCTAMADEQLEKKRRGEKCDFED